MDSDFIIKRARLKPKVRKYIKNHILTLGKESWIPSDILSNEESFEHVVAISTDVVLNSSGINTSPGSFVSRLISNDLIGAFGCADHINVRCIGFYAHLMYNLPFVKDLEE